MNRHWQIRAVDARVRDRRKLLYRKPKHRFRKGQREVRQCDDDGTTDHTVIYGAFSRKGKFEEIGIGYYGKDIQ